MKPFSVEFQTRGFGPLVRPPEAAFEVVDYGWAAVGGPDLARIEVSGASRAVWDCRRLLRSPVTIYDWLGNAVWWGYVHALSIDAHALSVGLSLDEMVNDVAVTYSVADTSGEVTVWRETTTRATEADSITEYGRKQATLSQGDISARQAVALASRTLERAAWPVQTVSPGDGPEIRARIEARGWWHTLDWQYFSRGSSRVAHANEQALGVHGIGNSTRRERVAQSFVPSVTLDTNGARLRLGRTGEPTDSAQVTLQADSGGQPSGVPLAAATVDAEDLGTSPDWIAVDFDALVTLAAGTTYWLVIQRTGALDADAYYSASLDTAAEYASGMALRYYTGTGWVAADPAGDFLFEITSCKQTSEQIAYAVTNAAQFVTGVLVETPSGVYTHEYRYGDQTTRYEVEALLALGTANGRRLLAEVTRGRYLRLWEEPARPVPGARPRWRMHATGVVQPYLGDTEITHRCPVGDWCELVDAPPLLDTNTRENACLFFVERAEFSPRSWRLRPEPRQARRAFDIGVRLEA